MPTVSVIIPCYNHGRFVDEAVDSALAQTHEDLEVVVVDDGSTGAATQRALEKLERPRTTVLRTPHRGKAAANNEGIRNSRGTYLLILDADDKIGPTYAERAVEILDSQPGVGIVYCLAELFGKRSGRWELPEFSLEKMLRGNLIFSSAFFRRAHWEQVGGFDEEVYTEDYDFWLSLLELGAGVHRIPEVLFYYRKHWDWNSKTKRFSRRQDIDNYHHIFLKHRDLYAQNVDVLIDYIRELKMEIASRIEALPHKRIGAGLKRIIGRP